MLQLYPFPAGKGDSILIHYQGISGTPRNILVDTGVTHFAAQLRQIFQTLIEKGEKIDYLMITHVDEDHLGGILSLMKTRETIPVSAVIMNTESVSDSLNTPLSIRQRNELSSLLIRKGIPILEAFRHDIFDLDGAELKILSPSKNVKNLEESKESANKKKATLLGRKSDYGYSLSELAAMPLAYKDSSPTNRESIVFLFKYEETRFLFTGDAWASEILAGLEACGEEERFDLIKLPHHGSVGNISEEWKEKLHSKTFLICTDGVTHPDKQTLAKLIAWYGEIEVYSTCEWWKKGMFLPEDVENLKKIQFHATKGGLEWK